MIDVLWQTSFDTKDTSFSFCGLGSEAATNDSVSFLGRAYNAGLLTNQTYSYVLAPYHDRELI